MNALIPRPVIVGTRPDFTPIYSENENAHAMSTYPCFDPATHPAPAMPPARRVGFSDEVVSMLCELHAQHVSWGWTHQRPDRACPHPAWDRREALRSADKATRVVQVLRDAGHDAEADKLRQAARQLERALLDGDAP